VEWRRGSGGFDLNSVNGIGVNDCRKQSCLNFQMVCGSGGDGGIRSCFSSATGIHARHLLAARVFIRGLLHARRDQPEGYEKCGCESSSPHRDERMGSYIKMV
jgi:hypothetical protein